MFWVSAHPEISSATGLSMLWGACCIATRGASLGSGVPLWYKMSASSRFLVTTLTQRSNDGIWKLFAQNIPIFSTSASFKIEAKNCSALFTASLCKESFSAFLLPREELSIEWGHRARSCKKARLSSSLCCKSSCKKSSFGHRPVIQW